MKVITGERVRTTERTPIPIQGRRVASAEEAARLDHVTSWPLGLSLAIGLAVLLLAALILSLGVGAVAISPTQVLHILLARARGIDASDATHATIVWDLRLARALLAVAVGSGLATAGAAYQALFRNPLADPFVIGASGGAALGATLAIVLGISAVMPAAFLGALAAVLIVYALAQVGGRTTAVNLLLAGAVLSTLLSAAVSLLMFLFDRNLHEVFAWLMGGFSGRSWPHLRMAAPAIGVGMAVLWGMARPLDALACGEESARSLGLNLAWARLMIVGAATLATAAAVASAGIIGFIGLLAPHAARRLIGGAHHQAIPVSALLGGLLLLLADDLARTVMAPVELPVGILTAMLGAPFFLWLLKRR
ncbi:MAG: iron ABC transporter permease [Anaerolineae bacterium]|nr:iron ABC transporter permease [Anaerolineae bacterium]MDW8100938.1 iron ABC transporter permease [Anaerolineae bacterium]